MNSLLLLALLADPGSIQPPPRNSAPSGIVSSGSPASCVNDDTAYAEQGVVGCASDSTTDPSGLMLRPGACSPSDGTCAAANTVLYGGQDTTTIAIDGADPSTSCAGDNDTVTVTRCDRSGTCTATILTEGTDWTASASVATTCASLAAAVEALSLVGASCTSPDVRITLDPTAGAVLLAESTAGCTTVDDGTSGPVLFLTDGTNASGSGLLIRTIGGVAGTDEGQINHTGSTFEIINRDSGSLNLRAASIGMSTAVGGNTTVTLIGAIGISGTVQSHIGVIYFCGQGPNGATTVYLSPRSSGLYGDATCDGEDSTTETTADEVWAPYDFTVGTMECGIADVAADTGVTFTFRDDTANTTLACTSGALDGSGFAGCADRETSGSPVTVAAGSNIAMAVTAASGNLTTADIWCRVTESL